MGGYAQKSAKTCSPNWLRTSAPRAPRGYAAWSFYIVPIPHWLIGCCLFSCFMGEGEAGSVPLPHSVPWGRAREGVQDLFHLQQTIYISQPVGVPEADDPLSPSRVSPLIVGDIVSMLPAVHLYHQSARTLDQAVALALGHKSLPAPPS